MPKKIFQINKNIFIIFFLKAVKKIHSLNSQISDYQQLGHQITAMFEWIRHTDNTLNARLKDDVYADDVPAETDVRKRKFFQFYVLISFFFIEINRRI
jgi:hypothetical protein